MGHTRRTVKEQHNMFDGNVTDGKKSDGVDKARPTRGMPCGGFPQPCCEGKDKVQRKFIGVF